MYTWEQDGRWAQLRTTFDHEMPNKKYGYGYMRAPWNLNPSPFVSRFAFDFNSTKDALPTCLSHYNSLRSEDMMEFFFQSEMEPHGGNHMETGGVYGERATCVYVCMNKCMNEYLRNV